MGTKITVKKPKPSAEQKPRALFIPRVVAKATSEDLPADPWDTALKALDPKKTTTKADGAVHSNAAEVEDDLGLFGNTAEGQGIINPPVSATDLEILVAKNSILPPLIDIMEVNIDGTGWEITPRDGDDVEDELDSETEDTPTDPNAAPKPPPPGQAGPPQPGDPPNPNDPLGIQAKTQALEAKAQAEAARQKMIDEAKKPIEDFFNECWPGVSFLTMRRRLRRDQEKVGYAYLEVLRNDAGEVVFCRRIDPKKMRLVRLDDPETVTRTVMRNGKEMDIEIELRARRFVQIIGRRIVWFKEFGEKRDMDRKSGQYAPPNTLDAKARATEILFFKNKEDIATPYGIPRWFSNVPSVIGSRKAEEFNLEFFDSGGIPPMMILVQGGSLATDVEQQIRDSFLASGSSKHQACILEAYSVGDMDSAKNVKVTVERFGSEQQKDSMFESYMENCDSRVQRSFRMPSIFLGMSADFSFATAFASYTVAEAQIFAPERMEFDEVINLQLMPELPNGRDFEFRSLPLAVRDVEQQLNAASLVKELIEPGDFVDEINGIVNANFQPKSEQTLQEEADKQRQDAQTRLDQLNGAKPGQPPKPGQSGQEPQPGSDTPGNPPTPGAPGSTMKRAIRAKGVDEIAELAEKGAELMRRGFGDAETAREWLSHREHVMTLNAANRGTYEALLAAKTFDVVEHDPQGLPELAGCAAQVLAANQ